jgi:amino acid transporter
MENPPASPDTIPARLGLWDAVSIIVGIVIGAGIYETAPFILQNVSGPWTGLGVWALGGLLSLIGALCYAELATTYPRTGGDYYFLSRAFGPWAGFLFGWAQLAVILTGSIGMMAYIFADYAARLWTFGPSPTFAKFIYAVLSVGVLTLLNAMGMVLGKGAQNLLTVAKVLGIGAIVVAGFSAPQSNAFTSPTAVQSSGSFGLAMILVLYTYGGWNDAAFVAAEQRNQRRNIPLALILGTLSITAVYLLLNTAYMLALGFEGARNAKEIAAVLLYNLMGPGGEKGMCLLVMLSALGAINGMILTGSRVYFALGSDHSIFAWLGSWYPRLDSPLASLVTQAVTTMLMITAVGTTLGQSVIDSLLAPLGAAVSWKERQGFETLLTCTAPIFWLFFLMTGLSLFLLRERDKGIKRPFSVPFYPVLPIIFCDTCGYMLYASTAHAGKLTLVGVAPLVIGPLLYLFSRRRAAASVDSASNFPL